MVRFVNNSGVKLFIILLLHLHFWGCSFFQTAAYPEPILVQDNEHIYIRYQFNEIRIIGTVNSGKHRPEAYIFAVFHRGSLDAPIIQKMFFPGDTLKLIVTENHLNAAPEGNLAVLKAIGDDYQQEEIAFSYTGEREISLPPFTVQKVPYYFEQQTIQLADEFTDSARTDSGGLGLSGLVEGLQIAKYPTRGPERNITSGLDSVGISAISGGNRIVAFIYSTPNEAELLIDDQKQGETPVGIPELSVGVHTFKLMKDGFAPLEKVLDIQPSQKVNIEFRMNRLNTIRFITEEKGLQFEIDGVHQWWDKKIKLRIESGEHILKVYKNGELIDEQVLKIDWNERIEYSLGDSANVDRDSIHPANDVN